MAVSPFSRPIVSLHRAITRALLYVLFAMSLTGTPVAVAQERVVRIGHFPNVTHVQALVARSLDRQGRGWFEPRMPDDVRLQWFAYNAGPSAMEAIFAGSLDLAYVGPNPAVNAYVRSGGDEIRVLAGAMRGGSALVVQGGVDLTEPADFRGKRIATPQFGNTQDVAARAWLAAGGLRITQTGGDAQVVPTANPDQLSLFAARQLDAVWTVEPWVSRLEMEAGGKVLVEEPDAVTTLLVSRATYLAEHEELVGRFVAAHRELTTWIIDHPAEAQRLMSDELRLQFRISIAPEVLARGWSRMTPTSEISLESLQAFVEAAQAVGFLRAVPDLSRLLAVPP